MGLARLRGALLRRPRSRGNWVQAFALHDTHGRGVLQCTEFEEFLESLALGVSRDEVVAVTECLAGQQCAVSLGGFSEAIDRGGPTDDDGVHDEAWAAGWVCSLLATSSTQPQGEAASPVAATQLPWATA